MTTLGPLYEVTYVVTPDARDEFEGWLRAHRERALAEPGIRDARGFEAEGADSVAYTFRYRIEDDNALEALLDGFFADADGTLAATFASSVAMHGHVLRVDEAAHLPGADHPNCLNCGAQLRGQYCGTCGQRARNRLISLWQLISEAFGDLFELDSRLWRTLLPLLIRPGKLTRDYLEGRRARYMPPFRTYLVLSVIFFVVAFFDPTEDLSVLFEPEPPPTAEEVEAAEFNLTYDTDDGTETGFFGDCETASIGAEEDIPEWLKKRFTDERVRDICKRNEERGNDNMTEAVVDNIPIALIVLLPLLAFVLKLLYPLSRRYFVEHLLFFVHFHAFFFLMLTLTLLFAYLVSWIAIDGAITTLIIVAASFYVPVYLYKAMRRVYGQGHPVTFAKYVLLVVAYLTGATITLAGTFLAVVLSA